MKALKIFEVQNFQRGIDPIVSVFGGIGERLIRKFRLKSFIKALSKYTREYLEKEEMNMEDFKKDIDEENYEWHYYYEIGQIIGSFINSFYPYKETADPEWGDLSLPTDPEKEGDYHPAFVRIIDNWIQKEFPEDVEERQIWEGIHDYMRYR
jgi:hypothetical protein